MHTAIIIGKGACTNENCKNSNRETSKSLECPLCGDIFCENEDCTGHITGGDGTTIKCPHCKEIILKP